MRPVVRASDQGEGGRWFVVCGRFPTEASGSAAYQLLLDKLEVGDLGLYRHGPTDAGGTHISAVSLDRPQVLRVARLLASRGGVDVELAEELVEAMIVRRARLVVEHAQAGGSAGRIKIKHAGRGARLDPDGTMRESGQGQG